LIIWALPGITGDIPTEIGKLTALEQL